MDQDCLKSLSGFSGANQEGMRQRFFPNRIRPRLTDPRNTTLKVVRLRSSCGNQPLAPTRPSITRATGSHSNSATRLPASLPRIIGTASVTFQGNCSATKTLQDDEAVRSPLPWIHAERGREAGHVAFKGVLPESAGGD